MGETCSLGYSSVAMGSYWLPQGQNWELESSQQLQVGTELTVGLAWFCPYLSESSSPVVTGEELSLVPALLTCGVIYFSQFICSPLVRLSISTTFISVVMLAIYTSCVLVVCW